MIGAGLRLGGSGFLAGLVSGPVRELVLAPHIGGVPAAWLECAVLAPVLAWIAWRCLHTDVTLPARAGVGAVALATTLLCEAALGLAFEASGLAGSRAPRGLAEQLPGILLLGWLALLPVWMRR